MEAQLVELLNKLRSSQDTAEASAPKRDASSWRSKSGKRGPRKQGIPKSSIGAPVVNPSPPGVVPAGQYLSKVSTELSNDPLSEKAYFPSPSSAFMETASKEEVYSGANVLPTLQDETYNQVCSVNPSYAKSVPKCAHDYYVGVLTYARLVKLHVHNGGSVSHDESLFLTRISEYGFTVPKSISLFLSGFGETKIPSGRIVFFGMAKPQLESGVIPLGEGRQIVIPGYFGAIIQNLGAYSSYPCLGIYAQRILQDLVHPLVQPLSLEWDLPADMREQKAVVLRG